MIETKSKQTSLSDHLTKEYKRLQALVSVQPALIQRYLELQGKQIAESIIGKRPQICFSLPVQIVCTDENLDRPALVTIPQNQRTYYAGNFMNNLRKVELHKQLCDSLKALEQSPDRAVSFATSLLRFSAAMHIVHNMLPAGRTIAYKFANEGEMIPFVPEDNGLEPESDISVGIDAIAVRVKTKEHQKERLVPFVPYARRFFLPQWIAFDENGDLLVKSVEEANSHFESMQRFIELIFLATDLAPYISADEEYVKKRYGMLGQLVNQGRALAVYHTKDVIALIKQLATTGNLNRGLSLSLPYFNDQELRIDIMKIEVIPAGRVMFVPAFVVLAVRQEEMKVSHDTRLNLSTRNHLLNLLERIERAFETS